MSNLYETLQVNPNASIEVIEASVKALLKKHHPDKGGSNSITIKILEAQTTLSDPYKRKAYDETLRGHGKSLGNYTLIKQIAEGGFGRVYEAKHTILGTKACVKHNINITPEDKALLLKEAEIIWELRHHAIPSMRDFIELEDGSCALVMSFIEGQNLFDRTENIKNSHKKLDPEETCWIIARVLDAMRYLHYSGIIHGDVKPQNIIVQDNTHHCALVDFGLSSVRPTKNSKPDGFTPMFASPESLSDNPLLPESDLYSLGLTMIYALGGDVEKRRIPVSTPKRVRDFIEKLIVHDIRNRPRWETTNLLEELRKVRIDSFGREHMRS